MELDCEGCAGCCVDWRPLAAAEGAAGGRGGRREPLDDVRNLVPLDRDEVAGFVDDGFGDVLVPRLFEPAPEDDAVRIDGRAVAAVDDRPVFVVGLRKPPKPVGPFGTEPHRLPACVFLDPETLQCRIHGEDRYPEACASYPGHNLRLDAETECERVEAAFDGDRLLDEEVPEELPPPLFGPAALGATVFAHPDPDELSGAVARLVDGELTREDRARFVGAAVGSRPGSLSVNAERADEAAAAVRAADSWAGRAIREYGERGGEAGEPTDDDPASAAARERDLGAPDTPGW